MSTKPNARERGDVSEEAVSVWLGRQGYAILQRNLRYREGEVDIVVYKDSTLVFVEVKARKSGGVETLEHSIHARKRARILRCAERFIAEHQCWRETVVRFDVVFHGSDGFHHFPGAFTESGLT